jgi:radical SAM protein with 4Fe4S-binding SPASM domain
MKQLLDKIGYVPRRGVWELTLRCNMRCLHCGSRAGAPRGDELTDEETIDLVDQLTALGMKSCTLSGGEPLLRENWAQIAERFAKRGARVNMISNGMNADRETVRRMRDAGMSNYGVSVDGPEESHDYVRGKKGSWKAAMQAMENCKAENFPTACVSHVNTRNYEELEQLAEILCTAGVRDWQIQFGRPMGNLGDHLEMVCKPETVLDLLPRIGKLYRKYEGRMRVYASDSLGYYSEDEELFRGGRSIAGVWSGCLAGVRVIGIEANGNIKGCLSMQTDKFVEGNIRQESLKTIWTKPGNFRYTRGFTLEQLGPGCRACDLADVCRGGCSWTSWMEGGRCGTFDNPYCYYRQAKQLENAQEPAGK